ncbi:hypothetical protein ATEIFO6365_0002052700 [Aspergillus terreus]|uniref:Uncharacterized protein n=1 Tax=Aspergillus terreus TaxID=33178 RepID=A0A5M3YV52_ASPTE|nr:hypothetical protein ATETN484_0004052700 [Aspergillus terreus]GFF13416.1 hypothetical protein ATEIFO6365_0002052700 [Aspergillus terreus]
MRSAMFSISHHISKQDQIHQMEREFIKHSMDRLSLPNITDETGPALLRMFRGLKLSPSSDAEEKEVWKLDQESMSVQMPDHFERYMCDVALIFSSEDNKSSAIRPRTDWILVATTAIVRKKKDQLYPDASQPSHQIYDALYYHFNTIIPAGSEPSMVYSVDYVLWYGARGDWDTNLVVVRSSSLLDGECWAAFPSMSVVHAARKAKKYTGGVYAICTDSYTWTFLHLRDKGRVSKRCLSWDDNIEDVIGQLYKIIGQAFDLHMEREKDPEAQQRMRDESLHGWGGDKSSNDDGRDDSDEDAGPW